MTIAPGGITVEVVSGMRNSKIVEGLLGAGDIVDMITKSNKKIKEKLSSAV